MRFTKLSYEVRKDTMRKWHGPITMKLAFEKPANKGAFLNIKLMCAFE